MGFGSLQIDAGALLVMGEHVEVQMRLVEGQLGSKMVSGPLADQRLSVQEFSRQTFCFAEVAPFDSPRFFGTTL